MDQIIGILVMAGQLLLALTILVGLHEMGHMLAAKFFGMRVEKFSIGFPPKLFSFKKGDTEYSLGATPLGGFVKISGMIDESLDVDSMKRPPEHWEFRSKPAWQRLIVMLGGIFVNVVTGIVVFICLLMAYGKQYLPASEAKYGIYAFPLAERIGLRTGDQILKINGHGYNDFFDVMNAEVLLGNDSYYIVQRTTGEVDTVTVPSALLGELSKEQPYLHYIFPFKVGQIVPGKPAEKAGLKAGDEIVQVDTDTIRFFHELQSSLQSKKNKKAVFKVLRDGKELDMPIQVTQDGIVGFVPEDLMRSKFDTTFYSPSQAIVQGTKDAFSIIWMNIQGFGKIFSGKVSASDSLAGPIGMATQFGSHWNTFRFWSLLGLISMVLAFMNLLPIPALDGGHVVLLIYEWITGRKPSDRFMEISTKIGMVILLSLMVFAFGNDIFKHIISNLF